MSVPRHPQDDLLIVYALSLLARVKRDLERRQRATERYNDVLERVLDDTESDFDDGVGIGSDEQADHLRETREVDTQQRRERMR